jgi:hypothetical protein
MYVQLYIHDDCISDMICELTVMNMNMTEHDDLQSGMKCRMHVMSTVLLNARAIA